MVGLERFQRLCPVYRTFAYPEIAGLVNTPSPFVEEEAMTKVFHFRWRREIGEYEQQKKEGNMYRVKIYILLYTTLMQLIVCLL